MESIVIVLLTFFIFEACLDALLHIGEFVGEEENYKSLERDINSGLYTGAALDSLISQKENSLKLANEYAKEFLIEMYGLIYSSWITITFLLKNISQIIFAKLNHKYPKVVVGESILSLISLFMTVYLTYFFMHYYKDGLDYSDDDYYFKFGRRVIENDESYTQIVLTILVVCLLIRMFYVLKASRVFGPMIEIISSMLEQLSIFTVILIGIIMIYMVAGRVLFVNIEEYKDNVTTIGTLVTILLGGTDFTIYHTDAVPIGKEVGYLYCISFVAISSITLLNFLIAILSHIYDKLHHIQIGLYLKYIIFNRQVQQNDNRYSWMICYLPPLNIFIFPLIPFILWFDSRKLNKYLLVAAYVDVIIVGTICFIVTSVLLTPFVYVIMACKLIVSIFTPRMTPKSRMYAVFDALIFILFGILLTLFRVIIDTIEFVKSCFEYELLRKSDFSSTNVMKRTNCDTELDPEFYVLFIEMLKLQKDKVVSAKTLITKQLSQALEIKEQVLKMLFQRTKLQRTSSLNLDNWSYIRSKKKHLKKDALTFDEYCEDLLRKSSYEHILKQFNLLKRIINFNSIPNRPSFKPPEYYEEREIFKDDNNQLYLKKLRVKKDPEVFYINEFLQMMQEINMAGGDNQTQPHSKICFTKLIHLNINSGTKLLTIEQILDKCKKKQLKIDTKKLDMICVNRNYKSLKKFLSKK